MVLPRIYTTVLIVVEDENEPLKFRMGSAVEIEVDIWYQTLPPAIRFDRDIKVDTFPAYGRLAPLVADNVAWLRGTYMAIPCMAYWEPAFTAATGPFYTELPDEHREAVVKFQMGFMKYVASARQYLDDKFHPLVWTQSQKYDPPLQWWWSDCSLFMGALMGVIIIESPRTYKLALPSLMEYLGHVVNILVTFARFSASIEESLQSLKGKIQGIQAIRR
jgi:hypothetical protein